MKLAKSILGMVCALGLTSICTSVNAVQAPIDQAPSANGQIQLAAWWWDNYDWRDRRSWDRNAAWRSQREWCRAHPRRCREAVRHRAHWARWCRAHPGRCGW